MKAVGDFFILYLYIAPTILLLWRSGQRPRWLLIFHQVPLRNHKEPQRFISKTEYSPPLEEWPKDEVAFIARRCTKNHKEPQSFNLKTEYSPPLEEWPKDEVAFDFSPSFTMKSQITTKGNLEF